MNIVAGIDALRGALRRRLEGGLSRGLSNERIFRRFDAYGLRTHAELDQPRVPDERQRVARRSARRVVIDGDVSHGQW